MTYDCIVIGGGPAGMIASIQMKRAGLSVVLFEKGNLGGLLRNANKVENYLGLPGLSGKKLIEKFKKHFKKHDIKVVGKEVLAIKKAKGGFSIQTKTNSYKTKNVILATGTVPKFADLEGEEKLRGKKLFYEVGDLPTMRSRKEVVIIGGGDAAFDYALNLHQQGCTSTIVVEGKPKCLSLLKKRVKAKKIPVFTNMTPSSVRQSGKQCEVICRGKTIKADYVLVAIGREPRYPHLPARKSVGFYFVGDAHNGRYRHVHIATGDAVRAAMDVIYRCK